MAIADEIVPITVATGLIAAMMARIAAIAVCWPVDSPLNHSRNWAASFVTDVMTGWMLDAKSAICVCSCDEASRLSTKAALFFQNASAAPEYVSASVSMINWFRSLSVEQSANIALNSSSPTLPAQLSASASAPVTWPTLAVSLADSIRLSTGRASPKVPATPAAMLPHFATSSSLSAS